MIKTKYLELLNKQNSLSLYIHIPFCNTKCYYCAFYSEAKKNCWDEVSVDLYLEKLIKELKLVKQSYNKIFDTVFIGGGNPGVLSFEQLITLLIEIGPSKETTFEINPESLTPEHINLFKEGLVTRISIGIQSFNDNILKMLGRNARYEDNIKALKFAAQLDNLKLNYKDNYFLNNKIISEEEYKKLNIKIKYSFDLMTSLPTQTLKDSINDIDTVLKYCDLKHLSLYCLTVEEGTHLYSLVKNKEIIPHSQLFEKDLLENLWKYLSKCGFNHYEVSNFEKDNNMCLHNLRYWDLSPYFSLGSSSASTIFDDKTLIRLTNISTIKKYLNTPLLSDYEIEILNRDQHFDEYLIVGLRNKRGLNFNYIKNNFNLNRDQILKAFKKLNSSYYLYNEDNIWLSEKGVIILDSIILDLSIEIEKLIK